MKKNVKSLVSLITALSLTAGLFAASGSFAPKAAAATTASSAIIPTLISNFALQPTVTPITCTLQGSNGDANATPDSTGVIYPVQMDTAGVLELSYTSLTSLDKTPVKIELFMDQACTQTLGTSSVISGTSKSASGTYVIPSAAIYYLRVMWNDTTVPDTTASINIVAKAFSGNELALTGEYQSVYTGDSLVTKFHSFTISKDSLVTIYGNELNNSGAATTLAFSLCDNAKTTLAQGSLTYANTYSIKYALKKGTYYVATSSPNKYQLKFTSTALKDQSKSTAKKATLIKPNKTVKGKVLLSDSTQQKDYYKVKITKKKKLKLVIAGNCTGDSSNLRVDVIPAKKKVKLTDSTIYIGNETKTFTSSKKLKKGVYYIRVQKVYADFSGSYTIKYAK